VNSHNFCLEFWWGSEEFLIWVQFGIHGALLPSIQSILFFRGSMILLDYSCTGCLGLELRSFALCSRTHPQIQRLFCKIQIKTHFRCLGFETGSSGMIIQNTSLDLESLYKIPGNNSFWYYGIWTGISCIIIQNTSINPLTSL